MWGQRHSAGGSRVSIRFGENYELDLGAYELRAGGEPLKVERIPMEILRLLVEQRSQLITREQIAERIWGKGVHLDIDNSINGAIRKIRQVLKDDIEHPRFIQTITGRGYRFIAPIHEESVVAPPSVPTLAPRPGWRHWSVAVPVGVVVLAGGLVWGRAQAAHPAADRVMLAVLPFQNLTGDPAQDYFSDGLTEEMITQLGNKDPRHFGVIARTSVMHYKSSTAPVDSIEGELGVQYVLTGSVRRDANRVRVTAQLVRARDQTQIWARQYDRELAGLLTLQSEIARTITSEIEHSLGGSAATTSIQPAPSTPSVEVYDLFLRGQFYLNRRSVPDLETAVRYFEDAVAKDSSYARAYASLADADALLSGYTQQPSAGFVAKARTAALRALALDSTLAEAHTALALIVQNYDLDWRTSEQEFRKAIDLNPNYATAHHWYAEHLMWLGHFDEALRESERARQLDPLSLIIAADNGAILLYSRQYDRAIEKFRSVQSIDPDFPRAGIIMNAYVEKGMFAEAQAELDREHPQQADPGYWAKLATSYGRSGRPALARRALQEMLRTSQHHPTQAAVLAFGYLGGGDKEQAIAWLERAYADHSNDIVSLKVNPALDPLRSDPRFQRLMSRVGLSN